jgi:peptide/nickel transport system permease protein
MARFLLRRTGTAVLTLLAASILVFGVVRAIPGDPVSILMGQAKASGEQLDPKRVEWVKHKYMLDSPLPVQYAHWIWLALNGDLGRDQERQPIGKIILGRAPVTFEIALLALVLAVIVGIPLGVIAAVRRGKPTDHAMTGLATLGMSIPGLWLSFLLITWFAIDLHWLPAGGYRTMHRPVANLEHMVLPVIAVSVGIAGHVARQTRASVLDALGSDYVRTARAKGLSEWSVVGRHALRNSLTTVVTVLGISFGSLLLGASIAEQIFGIPGFGNLTIEAIDQRDYPVVQAVMLVSAAALIFSSLLADICYSLLNPKVRVS